MIKYNHMKRASIILFGDLISFVLSFILLITFRLDIVSDPNVVYNHILPFSILFISWVLVFYMLGLYDLSSIKPTIPHLNRWMTAIITCAIVGIFLFYFVPVFGISPKVNLFIQIIGFSIFSFIQRRIIYSLFSKSITTPLIFVGSSLDQKELEKAILDNPQIGLKIIGNVSNINEIKINKKEKLIVILDNSVKIEDKDILNFYKNNVEVLDTACAYERYLKKIPVHYINLSFIIEEVKLKEETSYKFGKFITEKLFAILILIITSPILLISIIFKYLEDKGPIFIKQKRVGLNGKIFDIYKIRSMTATSEGGMSEKDGPVWSTGHDDPRITKVGNILRKLHIDEIPQMINILKGDLALIGPRPERPEFVDILSKEIPYYSFRHIVKPGFTGWAQVKYYYAHNVLEQKEKFEFDLYYIKNKNIFMDFGIFLRTVQIIFTH